jgi:hypothetical protein
VQYGRSWTVEMYFSGLKRSMGDVIETVRPEYIVQEIALKVQYYDIIEEMTYTY